MQTLFFGPRREVPSWYWVGKDIAEHLKNAFHIEYFDTLDEIAPGAVAFWIKSPPGPKEAALVKERQLRIIYFPVDQYHDESEIARDQEFIDACALLACHTASLAELFAGKRIALVDHYNKYGVDANRRMPDGRFLWIGAYQYFPYIYRYLKDAPLPFPIDILTDHRHEAGVRAANRLARRLDLDMDFADIHNFPAFNLVEWSESRQRALLLSCEGAFDYKHVDDFNQRFKPPTKIQKYLASGIPAAVNRESYSFAHMQGCGLALCDPRQTDIWRSAAYKARISEFAAAFAAQISMTAVSARYARLALSLSAW